MYIRECLYWEIENGKISWRLVVKVVRDKIYLDSVIRMGLDGMKEYVGMELLEGFKYILFDVVKSERVER